jgi:hypothetical protein
VVDDESLYRSRLSGLVARKAVLMINTVVPTRWDSVGTGRLTRNSGATKGPIVGRYSGNLVSGSFSNSPRRGSTTQTKVIPFEYRVPDEWPEVEVMDPCQFNTR